MWSVAPMGWFSSSYAVEEDGRAFGMLEIGKWRTCGEIAFGERRLTIRREGFWCPLHHLEEGGRTLASARSASKWRGGFRVEHAGSEYLLARSSAWGRSYGLTRGERYLGQVRATAIFSRRLEAELDPGVARELGLFAVWLVLLAWRQAAAAAAAS